MAATVDQKLLKSTKFPPEFNRKVNMTKVKVPVIEAWAVARLTELLKHEDDVVTEMCCDMLRVNNPNIKEIQIALTGFLNKDSAPFCLELWKLCLSAQESDQGVPKDLLEAKKMELMKDKEAEEAAKAARNQRQMESTHEREGTRDREVDAGRDRDHDRHNYSPVPGRDRGGRQDFGRRDSRNLSRYSPPRRHHGSDEYHPRATADTYVPPNNGRRGGVSPSRRPRSRSRSPLPRRQPRSLSPRPPRPRAQRSPQHGPDRHLPRADSRDRNERRGGQSARDNEKRKPTLPNKQNRSRSPRMKYRSRSTDLFDDRHGSRRRIPKRGVQDGARRGSRNMGAQYDGVASPPPRDGRSPSSSDHSELITRTDDRKGRTHQNTSSLSRSPSSGRNLSPPRAERIRRRSMQRYEPRSKVPERGRQPSASAGASEEVGGGV
ncbi:hypothetical protein LTR50_004276 [Elasticomyces elasticus]|nr:hypothetical protein LTR50_004276 [Elasticomyces elasticus]